jgi:peptidoglycan/xylan/chitin deacetylase (PgdA/CDA1 family)
MNKKSILMIFVAFFIFTVILTGCSNSKVDTKTAINSNQATIVDNKSAVPSNAAPPTANSTINTATAPPRTYTKNTSVKNVRIKSSPSTKTSSAKKAGTYTVPVLMYHSIKYQDGNPVRMSQDRFEAQMKWLSGNGYTTLTMDELFDHISKEKTFSPKSVVIAFDDGYRDNYTNAFPIIKKYGIHATIFMITGSIGHNDYLTADQIKEMSANGVDIQGHTVHHPNLDELAYDKQYNELKDSKECLEKLTGKTVQYIAYPMGRYNDNTIKALKALGYKMAFKMSGGFASVYDSRYLVNRVYVGGFDSLDKFISRVTNQ